MTNTARRPVAHIQHSPELETAACAVTMAKSAEGLPVNLCDNVFDVQRVRQSLINVAGWFEDPAFYGHGETQPAAEIAAATNLILLATLLREHLRAGNTT